MTAGMIPPDHEARRRIAEDLDVTMLVEAAAGTGKTTSLVGRMVELVAAGRCRVETMAAVTFTRKAAAELRERFRVGLERAAREAEGERARRLAEACDRVERSFIGTIHSFCARLLRERPVEAGVPLDFADLDDRQDRRLREEAWEIYAAECADPAAGRLRGLAETGLDLGELRETFFRYTEYPDVDCWPLPQGDLPDLAEPRLALSRYLAHMHSVAKKFPDDRGTDRLMDRYEHILRVARNRDLERTVSLMEVLALFTSVKPVKKHWPSKKLVEEEESRWNVFCTRVARPLLCRWREIRYRHVLPVLDGAAAVYGRLRGERGLLNYQDLLMGAARLLRDRPAVRRYFRRRYTHLLVDEFQDTDPVQAEVVLYLTAADPAEREWRRCRPVPGSLFVVGDPKQSIYRFRRADIVTYALVRERIEAAGGCVVPLSANFRSVGEVVTWCNRVFTAAFPAAADRYAPADVPMAPMAGNGGGEDLRGVRVLDIPPACEKRDNAVAYEADFIARFIRCALDEGLTLHRPGPAAGDGGARAEPGDFMVVTWGRKHLDRYAAALQRCGVPHQVTGANALADLDEVRLLSRCLRALTEPENPVALVGALRSELFGVSDDYLYDFRCAGGKFSFRAGIPEGLDAGVRRRFEEIFDRLRRCEGWLRRLPPLAAIERIAADLGLFARALAAPGGDVRAGSVAKAIRLLGENPGLWPSAAGAAMELARMVDEREEFDGIPARAHERPVVRVMNLHKAKGLEAPVVFLADPTGFSARPVALHVERGEGAAGYLAVGGEYGAPLAQAPGWEDLVKEEKRFVEAETTRLRYVAATRAGSLLVVSRKARRDLSWWRFFKPHLEECEPLEDPGPRPAPAGESVTVTAAEVEEVQSEAALRWERLTAPTYTLAAAREVALSPKELHRPSPAGEQGAAWGTVIHFLLETAMREPGADLTDLARAVLEEQGLPASLAERAVAAVEAVRRSPLWERARCSGQVLTEVPFATITGGDGEGTGGEVIRGVIDLAFREEAGWVIVDYKTDAADAGGRESLAAHYGGQVLFYADAWRRLTGEPVIETGLFFTATLEYVPVN